MDAAHWNTAVYRYEFVQKDCEVIVDIWTVHFIVFLYMQLYTVQKF